MKKVACTVLIVTMVIFLINPLFSEVRGAPPIGGHGVPGGGPGGPGGGPGPGPGLGPGPGPGHGHGHGGGYWGWWGPWGWWWPWAIIGGAAALPSYYAPYYHSPPSVYFQTAPSVTPPSEEKLFIYPRKGQSEKQQSDDRYQCHRWAVDQTNFDPTQPPGTAETETSKKYAEYRRAMGACLDARGYTVK